MTQVGSWPVIGALVGTLAWIGSPQQDTRGQLRVWTTTGPQGTRITALVIDPRRQKILYAGAWGAGVYRSSNGGVGWRSASTGLTNRNISTLVIDPQTPTTLYAGTATGDAGSQGAGIFKSTDAGDTWEAINAGLAVDGTFWRDVKSLAIDPNNPQILYAGAKAWYGTGAFVFKSIDGGDTWSLPGAGFRAHLLLDLAVDPQTPTTTYAVSWGEHYGASGVYKSMDGGATWGLRRSGLPTSSSNIYYPPYLTLAINPEEPSVLYVGTADDGVFKSTDGGGTWEGVNTGLPRIPFQSRYPQIAAVNIDPSHPDIVYAGLAPLGPFKSI
jgi:hypothetical protein